MQQHIPVNSSHPFPPPFAGVAHPKIRAKD